MIVGGADFRRSVARTRRAAVFGIAGSQRIARSFQAMQRMGKSFGESDSDSVAMIVLESDRPLGDEAHRYYNDLVRQLNADTRHVQHVQDYWGDPLTAPAGPERR